METPERIRHKTDHYCDQPTPIKERVVDPIYEKDAFVIDCSDAFPSPKGGGHGNTTNQRLCDENALDDW